MRVEFVFELDGDTYRVVRTRWRTGKADIAFNVRAPDGSWTDLAGEGLADTQRRVIDRLRMDYETFVASAFILQGRADTFTRLDPRQRKDVLGKILGLEIYERLAERAKERRKDAQAEGEAFATLLVSLDRDLSERPALEQRAAESSVALATADADRTAAAAAVATVQARVDELRGVEAAATEAAKRLEDAAAALAHEDEEITRLAADTERLAEEDFESADERRRSAYRLT
jgi:exonuclease SbcC